MFAGIAITALLLAQAGPMPAHCDAVRAAALAEEARAALSLKQFDNAVTRFHDASNACPQDEKLLLDYANALLMARKFAEAVATCDSVLRGDEGNAAALKIKGNAEYFLG